MRFAEEKGASFVSTSAKENEGIEEMFRKIAFRLYQRHIMVRSYA